MTDNDERDPELEARLRAHYREVEPGAASPGWEARVDRAIGARRSARRTWQPALVAAAIVAVAIGLIGGIRLLTLPSTAATPSPTPMASSSSAALVPTASAAPSATPSASGNPIKPTPAPTATLSPAEVAASVDQAGSFPGGLWAVRGSQFLVSTDAGAHWTPQAMPSGKATSPTTDPMVPIVTMTDSSHVWVLTAAPGASIGGGGSAADVLHLIASRSVDGGRTWASSSVPGNWPGTIVRMAFPDPEHGFILVMPDRLYAGAINGAVIATTDGGRSWSIVSRETGWARGGMNPWLGTEFAASDATTLWAGANQEAGPVVHPVLAVSRDAGATWREVTLPGLAEALGGTIYGGTQVWAGPPVFTSPTAGWVTVGANDHNGNPVALLYRTTDGGQTWTPIPIGYHGQPSGSLAVLDASHWLVPVDNVPGSVTLTTSDAGATWSIIPGAVDGSSPWIVWITGLDATHAAATTPVGNSYPDRVVLLLSADAGRTWAPATLPAR